MNPMPEAMGAVAPAAVAGNEGPTAYVFEYRDGSGTSRTPPSTMPRLEAVQKISE